MNSFIKSNFKTFFPFYTIFPAMFGLKKHPYFILFPTFFASTRALVSDDWIVPPQIDESYCDEGKSA
jgi:hypothetical protein